MKYEIAPNIELKTKERAHEFKAAIKYLLETFPPKKVLRSLEIKFKKADMQTAYASADYDGFTHLDGRLESVIRVSYGKNGTNPKALNYLFHEYKHLLQDADGYLYDPVSKLTDPIRCVEAQAWADEQLPVYLELQQLRKEQIKARCQARKEARYATL